MRRLPLLAAAAGAALLGALALAGPPAGVTMSLTAVDRGTAVGAGPDRPSDLSGMQPAGGFCRR